MSDVANAVPAASLKSPAASGSPVAGHHVLPQAVFNQHRLFKSEEVRKRIARDADQNIINVPTTDRLAADTEFGPHRGPHPTYSDAVRDLIDDIADDENGVKALTGDVAAAERVVVELNYLRDTLKTAIGLGRLRLTRMADGSLDALKGDIGKFIAELPQFQIDFADAIAKTGKLIGPEARWFGSLQSTETAETMAKSLIETNKPDHLNSLAVAINQAVEAKRLTPSVSLSETMSKAIISATKSIAKTLGVGVISIIGASLDAQQSIAQAKEQAAKGDTEGIYNTMNALGARLAFGWVGAEMGLAAGVGAGPWGGLIGAAIGGVVGVVGGEAAVKALDVYGAEIGGKIREVAIGLGMRLDDAPKAPGIAAKQPETTTLPDGTKTTTAFNPENNAPSSIKTFDKDGNLATETRFDYDPLTSIKTGESTRDAAGNQIEGKTFDRTTGQPTSTTGSGPVGSNGGGLPSDQNDRAPVDSAPQVDPDFERRMQELANVDAAFAKDLSATVSNWKEKPRVAAAAAKNEKQRLAEEKEKQRLSDAASAKDKQQLADLATAQETRRLADVAAESDRQRISALAVERDKRLANAAAVKEKQRLSDLTAAQETQRLADAATSKEKQRVADLVTAKETKRLADVAAEKEKQRLAAVTAEQERQRAAAVAAEQEKQRQAAAAAAEKQRLAAVAAEQERQRLAATAAEHERQRAAAAAAEKERQRLSALAAEQERQRLAAAAAEQERQRVAAATAESEKQRLAAAAAEQERQRLETIARQPSARAIATFDPEYYSQMNQDVATGWKDTAQSLYNQYGWREGRNPNASFDTRFVLDTNSDLKNNGIHPFEHWRMHGYVEGRLPYAGYIMPGARTNSEFSGIEDFALTQAQRAQAGISGNGASGSNRGGSDSLGGGDRSRSGSGSAGTNNNRSGNSGNSSGSSNTPTPQSRPSPTGSNSIGGRGRDGYSASSVAEAGRNSTGGRGRGGYSASSAGGSGSYGKAMSPVLLDVNNDQHIDLRPFDAAEFADGSALRFDWDGDGAGDGTGWAGPSDAWLAIDLASGGNTGPDDLIDQARELAFVLWKSPDELASAQAETSDLESLRLVFDTNRNDVLDPADARWSEFRLWQDANQNGTTDSGELRTLEQADIRLIELVPTSRGARQFSDGSAITGTSTYVKGDGTRGLVGDATVAYHPGRDLAAA